MVHLLHKCPTVRVINHKIHLAARLWHICSSGRGPYLLHAYLLRASGQLAMPFSGIMAEEEESRPLWMCCLCDILLDII
jgi:hypothetical protein